MIDMPLFSTQRRGFTMIELLVVVTIMIMLTAVGIVSYQSASRNARNGTRKANLETVRSALVLYRTDEGSYPTSSDGVTGNGNRAAFNSMITVLNSAGYLSSSSITDPKDDGTYEYTYTYGGGGATFTLDTTLEPDPGLPYSISNP